MKTLTIQTPRGPRLIGAGQPTFIIAEMSANHKQNFDKAVAIVKAAAEAGADAIKLQTYLPGTMTMDSRKEYFMAGGDENPESWKKPLYELYQESYTPEEWHAPLKKLAEELGLVFLSAAYDESAVDFLETLNIPIYKVASYEVTHTPLLKKIGRTGKPVIMSTGFATLEEVELAVKTLREYGTKDLAILHCVTAYTKNPRPEETNLAMMQDIERRFDVVAGFSDNNAGVEIPLQSVMMGAAIVEKHFIDDQDEVTFDSDFSSDTKEFRELVQAIRRAEKTVGRVNYGPQSEAERHNMRYRRSVFVVSDIKAGEVFSSENVKVIRPSFGLAPKHYEQIIGRRAAVDIESGEPLQWNLIEGGQSEL